MKRERLSKFQKCDMVFDMLGQRKHLQLNSEACFMNIYSEQGIRGLRKSLIEGLESGRGRMNTHHEHRGHKKTGRSKASGCRGNFEEIICKAAQAPSSRGLQQWPLDKQIRHYR